MQQQKKEKKERTGMSCELNETINNDKNGRNPPTLGYGMIKSPVKDFIKKYYKKWESYKNSSFLFSFSPHQGLKNGKETSLKFSM